MSHIYALFPTPEERDQVYRALDAIKGYPSCRIQDCPLRDESQEVQMRRGVPVGPVCSKEEDGTPVWCPYVTEHLTTAYNSDETPTRYAIMLTPEVRELSGQSATVDGQEVTVPTTWDEYTPPHDDTVQWIVQDLG